jgi:hypothetical protein
MVIRSLPLVVGSVVDRCSIDLAVTIECLNQDARFSLRIESPGTIASLHEEVAFDPADRASLSPFLRLVGESVSGALVEPNGTLVVTFRENTVLRALPDPEFEAWQLVSENGYLLVCGPGGELTEWNAGHLKQ